MLTFLANLPLGEALNNIGAPILLMVALIAAHAVLFTTRLFKNLKKKGDDRKAWLMAVVSAGVSALFVWLMLSGAASTNEELSTYASRLITFALFGSIAFNMFSYLSENTLGKKKALSVAK